MGEYVSFVSKNRKALIFFLVIMNLLAIAGIFQIKINPDFDAFIPDNSEAKEIYDRGVFLSLSLLPGILRKVK